MGDAVQLRYVRGRAVEVTATAVLASGGLDSAALLAETASTGVAYPIYVEAGMVWESAERTSLERFVAALDNPNVRSHNVPVLAGGSLCCQDTGA